MVLFVIIMSVIRFPPSDPTVLAGATPVSDRCVVIRCVR